MPLILDIHILKSTISIFQKNCIEIGSLKQIIQQFEVDSLWSMSFSIVSMISNNWVFRNAMAAKQTNMMIVPEIPLTHTIYSMKPSATQNMYTKIEAAVHPNIKKPMNSCSLNEYFWVNWFDALMPNIAYCFWIVWKIFIFSRKKVFFWIWQSQIHYLSTSVAMTTNLCFNSTLSFKAARIFQKKIGIPNWFSVSFGDSNITQVSWYCEIIEKIHFIF